MHAEPVRGDRCVIVGVGFSNPVILLRAGVSGWLPPGPAPRPSRLDVTRTERPTPRTADTPTHQAPRPAAGNDPLPAGRVKGAYGAATRALRAP